MLVTHVCSELTLSSGKLINSASKSEGAELKIDLEHIGPCSGDVEVNKKITYKDKEKNKVTFPSPSIYVDCSTVVRPESCPVPVDVSIDGCTDVLSFDAGEPGMQSLGRIL
jgi:Ca-activated chloride channel family protein